MRRGAPALVTSAVLALVAVPLAGCSSGSQGRTGATESSASSTAASGTPSAAPTPGQASGPPAVTSAVVPWRLPAPLSRSVAIGLPRGALLAGGLMPGDRSTDQVLNIDVRAGTVTRTAPLAEPVHDSAGGLVHGRPTVVGGGASTELSDVQQRSPSGTWRVVGQLPTARSDLSVVSTARGLLVVGGYDGTGTPTPLLRTTDGSTFTDAGSLPRGVRYAGVVATPQAVWVLGGEVDGAELQQVFRVDQRTGEIRAAGRLPEPLGHEAVVAVGPRLLVMGGRTGPDTVTDRMWWFTPASRHWAPAGRLPYAVADAPVVTSGDAAYLLGGESPGFTARVTRVSWG